jgi:hypothetical protein
MTMPVSEKNFLEQLASHVPGLAGYRERESRRETDRRLREFLASRLEDGRRGLDLLRNKATAAGDLPTLDAVGRLDRTLQKTVASLRFANRGYSGVFDQVKIREAELDAIYAYDAALLGDVVALGDRLRAAAAGALEADALAELSAAADGIDLKVDRRREVLETPTTA